MRTRVAFSNKRVFWRFAPGKHLKNYDFLSFALRRKHLPECRGPKRNRFDLKSRFVRARIWPNMFCDKLSDMTVVRFCGPAHHALLVVGAPRPASPGGAVGDRPFHALKQVLDRKCASSILAEEVEARA
ncbi:hypothetical protein [Martelella soudanensis]|uniref:hypothetical protein n=1 Tax=unclassified Martelella TaxID=2629616 RepID=UPI0015E02EF2|nr:MULTISPECIES: hypothetical protein [unclassified Martelella]